MIKYFEVCWWLESILPSASELKTEWQQVLFIGTLCNSGGAISGVPREQQ